MLGGVLEWSDYQQSRTSLFQSSLGVFFFLVCAVFARNHFFPRLDREASSGLVEPTLESASSDFDGILLVVLGITLPMGEGLAYGAGIVLLIRLLWTGKWKRVTLPPLVYRIGLGFAGWIIAGVLAYFLGGYGWIRPKELGRILPFVSHWRVFL